MNLLSAPRYIHREHYPQIMPAAVMFQQALLQITYLHLESVSNSRYLSTYFQLQGLLILFLIVCLQWISQHLTHLTKLGSDGRTRTDDNLRMKEVH